MKIQSLLGVAVLGLILFPLQSFAASEACHEHMKYVARDKVLVERGAEYGYYPYNTNALEPRLVESDVAYEVTVVSSTTPLKTVVRVILDEPTTCAIANTFFAK